MKIRKSISAILLSLLLCLCMLPVPMAFAAGEVTVTVSGGSQIAFDAATTEYAVTVPVWYASGVDSYTYENPVITVDNAGTAVAVTMPATLPGNATFTIGETTYTIALSLAANMYENGGAETGSRGNFIRANAATGLEITDADAYSGTRSMVRPSNYSNGPFYYLVNGAQADVALKKGKTYLTSYATRLKPGVTMTTGSEYRLMDMIESPNEGESATASFYLDGVKTGETTEADQGAYQKTGLFMSHDWKQLQAVVEPVSDSFTIWHYSLDEGWTAARRYDLLLDDVFVAELAVGNMTVTDAEGNSASTIIPDTVEDKTLNLTGTILNQLGTVAGFDSVDVNWTADAGISVANGVVTIPANLAAGEYTITATADLSDINNIGTVSAAYTLTVGDAQSGDLAALTITGNGLDLSKFDFESATTEYTVGVPVRYAEGVDSYTYTMPTISATPLNNEHQIVVTPAEALPGTATIEVKKGEDVLKTYSVNLVALGANMYANGGAETGSRGNFIRANAATGLEITDADAYSGTRSMVRPSNYSNSPFYYLVNGAQADVALKKGKTYLTSYATRLKPDVTMTTGSEYRLMDMIESPNEGESATASFYLDGVKTGETTEADKGAHQKTGLFMSHDWKQLQAVVEPVSDSFTIWHYSLDEGWTAARRYDLLLDDVFAGELIIGGVQLEDAYGAKLPAALSTTVAHSLTLSAGAVNQLGTTAGLEGKTEVGNITVVGALPEGVTFENNELTIAQGAEGVVTLSATATPTGDWTTQEAFTDTIKLTLVNGSFAYEEANGKVTCILSHYTGNVALDAVLYHAIYSKVGDVLTLESVICENVSGFNDEFIYDETELTVESGQVVKSFLWVQGDDLTPCAVNGVFGE